MRALVLVAAVLSGCATRADVRAVYLEQRGLALSALAQRESDLADQRILRERVYDLEKRADAVAARLRGPWEREECENYTPAAQRLFCKRKPTAVDKTFDEIAEEVARELDAKFCRERGLFCPPRVAKEKR